MKNSVSINRSITTFNSIVLLYRRIVGAHRVADETLRLHEYSPNFDPERFAAHERFFVEDVGAWACGG